MCLIQATFSLSSEHEQELNLDPFVESQEWADNVSLCPHSCPEPGASESSFSGLSRVLRNTVPLNPPVSLPLGHLPSYIPSPQGSLALLLLSAGEQNIKTVNT